ncbi:MAG: ribosome small subunit-dependent GTPase A [Clostridia bacterium]|nr:ribosome small subunit-dependent GTPase A [Clostridia bacterium]
MKDKVLRTGQVIKGVGGNYNVLADGNVILCNGRGKLRLDGNIFIGDYVEFVDFENGKGAIEKILPRKNKITRPYITNIDMIVICIAPSPRPDFYLVDKLLINCIKQNITPILCVNKIDLMDKEFKQNVEISYANLCDICYVCSLTGEGIDKLTSLMANNYVSMAGQSATGKSSIINSIVGRQMLETGELSRKIERGRHTTRNVEIFDIGHGIRLADTCGFSVLELENMNPNELSTYFTDFDDFARYCKFNGCNHLVEPDCAVKRAVEQGKLSKDRYLRYVSLYNDLMEKWRKRYD